ncbi:hypothetical protein A3Q56_05210 [Intoshia linei]|uniref:VPS10 domain-containing protein n=1 Tax=Intoshia linei TaxID=1819745 RepID=A0A177AZZ4_9BILA|nr:hypothetical protein A3Q56_05210 [Intoshia linei]
MDCKTEIKILKMEHIGKSEWKNKYISPYYSVLFNICENILVVGDISYDTLNIFSRNVNEIRPKLIQSYQLKSIYIIHIDNQSFHCRSFGFKVIIENRIATIYISCRSPRKYIILELFEEETTNYLEKLIISKYTSDVIFYNYHEIIYIPLNKIQIIISTKILHMSKIESIKWSTDPEIHYAYIHTSNGNLYVFDTIEVKIKLLTNNVVGYVPSHHNIFILSEKKAWKIYSNKTNLLDDVNLTKDLMPLYSNKLLHIIAYFRVRRRILLYVQISKEPRNRFNYLKPKNVLISDVNLKKFRNTQFVNITDFTVNFKVWTIETVTFTLVIMNIQHVTKISFDAADTWEDLNIVGVPDSSNITAYIVDDKFDVLGLISFRYFNPKISVTQSTLYVSLDGGKHWDSPFNHITTNTIYRNIKSMYPHVIIVYSKINIYISFTAAHSWQAIGNNAELIENIYSKSFDFYVNFSLNSRIFSLVHFLKYPYIFSYDLYVNFEECKTKVKTFQCSKNLHIFTALKNPSSICYYNNFKPTRNADCKCSNIDYTCSFHEEKGSTSNECNFLKLNIYDTKFYDDFCNRSYNDILYSILIPILSVFGFLFIILIFLCIKRKLFPSVSMVQGPEIKHTIHGTSTMTKTRGNDILSYQTGQKYSI